MANPNILLIVLDSVRARNCSLYGHKNETTPFLSEFSDTATVFRQARAPSIESISSHASIFSGYHTYQHKMYDFESHLSPKENIWWKLSNIHQYNTGMFSSNTIVTQTSNLSDVFDTVVGPKQTRSDLVLFESAISPKDFKSTSIPDFTIKSVSSENPLKSFINGVYYQITSKEKGAYSPEKESADVYVKEFLNWVSEQDKPWGACINFMDAHIPYIPDEKYNHWGSELHKQIHNNLDLSNPNRETYGRLQAIQSLYDGCIRQLDSMIESLITEMKNRNIFEDTLVVITSDHGEAFGERSSIDPSVRVFGHNHGIHEVLTHVPLIVKEPKQSSSAVESQVASLTNFPTAVHAAIQGDDISTKFLPDDEYVLTSCKRSLPPEFVKNSSNSSDSELWKAVYTDDGKSTDILKYSLWGDLSASRRVKNAQITFDISGDKSDLVKRIYENLDEINVKSKVSGDQQIDSEVQGRLSDLGYID